MYVLLQKYLVRIRIEKYVQKNTDIIRNVNFECNVCFQYAYEYLCLFNILFRFFYGIFIPSYIILTSWKIVFKMHLINAGETEIYAV